VAVLGAVATVGLIACAPSTGTSRRSDAPRVEAPARAAVPTADAVNAFGADLLGAVAATDDGNVAVAPYSTARTLAMSRVGAREETRTELDRVLHVEGVTDLDTGFNALDAALASREGTRESERRRGRVRIDSSTSLWAQQGTRFDPTFLDVLSAQYDTGMRTVDFRSDPEEATKAVNRWVQADTDGQVPELVPRGTFSVRTRFVLAGASAVRAPWLVPFATDTADRPFTLGDGRSVPVPTMVTASDPELRTAQGEGWQAVELPYVGGELALLVVVPDAGTADAFVEGLTGEGLDDVVDRLVAAPVEVSLPTFAFTTRLVLDDALAVLGLDGALTEGVADFTGITTDEPLAISDVVHQTFVSAGPEGSDAEGTTVVTTTGARARAVATPVVVDRPFVVAVRDLETGAVLQLARVADPRG
jgi:serpin B